MIAAHTPGIFITLEGGDGVGKTTQISCLKKKFETLGRSVCVTREPGGSPGAEVIRGLLVTGAADRWSPLTEALLMNAARADHLEKTIRPALEAGQVVICDRFCDSTMAYQGIAGSLNVRDVETLQKLVVGETMPDMTLVLTLGYDTGLNRANNRADDKETRFEAKGRDYQLAVTRAFEQIACANPDRCVTIDANGSVENVAQTIWHAVSDRLKIDSDNNALRSG